MVSPVSRRIIGGIAASRNPFQACRALIGRFTRQSEPFSLGGNFCRGGGQLEASAWVSNPDGYAELAYRFGQALQLRCIRGFK